MKASVGDRIVIASNRLDRPLRDGRIVECRHEDGSPPYVVEWSDTGQTGLFFPGPDAHVEHLAGEIPARQGEAQPARHIKTWRVEVSLFESDGDTTAHAVLVAEVPGIGAKGSARRHPPRRRRAADRRRGGGRAGAAPTLGPVAGRCVPRHRHPGRTPGRAHAVSRGKDP